MSFAENLRQLRKQRCLSQEELAELMDVSRQAVSKWEQGEIYPEVEKLLLLANRLNISLDSLLSAEIVGSGGNACATGSIVITSPHEHVIAACRKVLSSQRMHGGKNAPQFALFGTGSSGVASAYWGEPTTFLGWYADEESLSREIGEIQQAITRGQPAYTLCHSVKVEHRLLGIRMVKE